MKRLMRVIVAVLFSLFAITNVVVWSWPVEGDDSNDTHHQMFRPCNICQQNFNNLINAGITDMYVAPDCECEESCDLPNGKTHDGFYLTGETLEEILPQLKARRYWWCDDCLYKFAQLNLLPSNHPEWQSIIDASWVGVP